MSSREPTESSFPWPIWSSGLLVGLLLVFIAPQALTAPDGSKEPGAASSPNAALSKSAPKEQPGDQELRLRRLEDKMERVLRILEGPRNGQHNEPIIASGKTTTKDIKIADFTNVHLRSAIAVEIARADSFKVTVTASDNLLQHVQIVKEGKTLNIGMEPGMSYQSRGDRTKVTIAMPALESVDLGGASLMTVAGFKPKEFKAKVAGASALSGTIDADKIALNAGGASKLALTGSAKDGLLAAAGASTLQLADFPLASAVVNLSGASSATVRTTANLSYNVSGASRLKYLDNPKVVGKKSGASSVSRQ